MARNAVIFHHPDSVETDRNNLMGRHAAGEGFLNGLVAHGGLEGFFAHTFNADHFADFARRVRQGAGGSEPCRRVGHDMIGQHDVPGVLNLPGPELAPFSWRRRQYGNAAYSLCGVNHTIASARVMDALGELLTAPIQPWDALICTSHTAKAAMRHVMEDYAEYLAERMQAQPAIELMMPVIPLGVDCNAFAQDASATADRAQLRHGLGIGPDDVALLYMGRFSFHAKAHPLPMYLAAEAAARRSGRRVHLILAGWFANQGIEREFRDGARTLCPSVNAIFLDGRDKDVRRRIWRAADVFISLSDNIQETFGLTPIEAMAAGLPVVVSDWDGYRETVSDGEHGFTIPTWMPAGGVGGQIAMAPELDLLGSADEARYDRYCGEVSQATAIDTGACIDALSVLCSDADKRHAMGEAGREHAKATFDWSVIVAAYQDLWEELDDRRARAGREVRRAGAVSGVPLRADPFSMFAAYPTHQIGDNTELRLVDGVDGYALNDRLGAPMNSFAEKQLLDRDGLERIINVLSERGSATVQEIASLFDRDQRSYVMVSVGWLAKMYLIRLSGGHSVVLDVDNPAGTVQRGGAGNDRASHLEGEAAQIDTALDLIDRRNAQGMLVEPSVGHELLETLLDVPMPELMERMASARSEGNLPLAAACLHRASTLVPDDPEINVQMGELLTEGERLDAAIACFRRAIQTFPDHLGAHRSLGKALFLRGDEAEGIHSFRRAVRLAPEDSEARLLLGTALRQAGAVNEAMQCLRIAMEIDPERAEAGYHLGLVYRAMDRPDDAREVLERVVSIDANHQFAHAALLSMEAKEHGESVSKHHDGRKIGLLMVEQSDFFALKPVFDALCEEFWPLLSGDVREITAFEPDVILGTSPRRKALRDQLPICPFVQVPSDAARRPADVSLSATADVVCAVTDGEQQSLLETGLTQQRIWVTGLPLTDPLFAGAMRRSRRPSRGKGERKRVLFMPDWRAGAGSVDMTTAVLEGLGSAREGAYDLVVRPHPVTLEKRPGWVEAWEDLAASHPNVRVVTAPGEDYLAMMADADVLLADFSPLAFTFLAFDAPMVLVRPPQDTDDSAGLNEQQTALLESVARCVDRDDDVVDAVVTALESGEEGDEARARMRSVVFGGGADGHAAERVVDGLRALLAE